MGSLEETLGRRNSRSRKWDIVLWGATGYTGQLVAEYLKQKGPADLRWAIAGRNREKLERVRRDVGLAENVAVIVGDSLDRSSLDDFVAQASVVCTTVGPYARYGEDLVASCVEHGTDYCDLTGEMQFIRRMIDRHQDAAGRSGARIVHCCGYDSIPSDLGCLMLHEYFRNRGGGLISAVMYVDKTRGGMSGGTAASMITMMEQLEQDRLVKQVMKDPYSLNPEGEREGSDTADVSGVKRDAKRGGWTAPFLMAAINTRIVRRSNALMGYPYSKRFRYDELMRFPDTTKGMLMASAVTSGLTAAAGASFFRPTRALLQRYVLPSPGEGPTASERERGMFRHTFHAEGQTPDGVVTCEARVAADQDPGYGATSRMLGESALCLALDGATLDSPGGILTPAACMGRTLLRRLRDNAGMVFEVD